MSEITKILDQLARGDPAASDQLLPLVYSELRKLARSRLSNEAPGNTLQPTDLVHEAYLRLVLPNRDQTSQAGSQCDGWNSRGHFFSAAAIAMRRILVESARRKKTKKRLAPGERQPLSGCEQVASTDQVDLVELDEALHRLAVIDSQAAKVVELRYFAGMTICETANALGVSERTVKRNWNYAKVWLRKAL